MKLLSGFTHSRSSYFTVVATIGLIYLCKMWWRLDDHPLYITYDVANIWYDLFRRARVNSNTHFLPWGWATQEWPPEREVDMAWAWGVHTPCPAPQSTVNTNTTKDWMLSCINSWLDNIVNLTGVHIQNYQITLPLQAFPCNFFFK